MRENSCGKGESKNLVISLYPDCSFEESVDTNKNFDVKVGIN